MSLTSDKQAPWGCSNYQLSRHNRLTQKEVAANSGAYSYGVARVSKELAGAYSEIISFIHR